MNKKGDHYTWLAQPSFSTEKNSPVWKDKNKFITFLVISHQMKNHYASYALTLIPHLEKNIKVAAQSNKKEGYHR